MPLLTITPSPVAVLRTAATLHACVETPQHADCFVAIARAAELLDAPARIELQATNALEEALGADSEYWAFLAAIDELARRRMDVDLWLQDWHAYGR